MVGRRSPKRKRINSIDIIEGKNSLRFLAKKHKVSPSTTSREIREQTSRTPIWEQVTAYMNYSQLPGIRVASMDITWIGTIQGKSRWALVVTDALTGDIVVYQPMDNQKAYTLVEILERLKKTGYIPRIVIIDGAGALRIAVERVYPDAKIQRCIFHLECNVRLSKDLKPRKNGKTRNDGYTKRNLIQVQKQCIKATCAWTKSERETAMLKLEELTKQGGRPRLFLQRLKKKLQYFHTFDEPLFAEFQQEMRTQWKTRKLTKKEQAKGEPEIRTTNYTERMCGIIKSLRGTMRGFGSIDSAYYLINEKMLVMRVGEKEAKKLKRILIKTYDFKPLAPYRMPPELYCNSVNKLLDLAHRYDLPLESLTAECKRLGLIIHRGYALTPEAAAKVEVDRRALSKCRNKKVRLKKDSFIFMDDLNAEQSSNLSVYCSFENPPVKLTCKHIEALTKYNSAQGDHRFRFRGTTVYSSLDLANYLKFTKATEWDLYPSTAQQGDLPLGIKADGKKGAILPLQIAGTNAQTVIDETPTLEMLIRNYDNRETRVNSYRYKPFSLIKYSEDKKKNTQQSTKPLITAVQTTLLGTPRRSAYLQNVLRRRQAQMRKSKP